MLTIREDRWLVSIGRCRFAAQHGLCGRDDGVNRDRGDAMRIGHATTAGTGIQTGGGLQDARVPAIGAEAYRAVAVVRVAVSGVARDDDGLAVHRRCQVRRPAVVADEQVAAFKHGTHLAQRRAGDDDRFAGPSVVSENCAVPEGTLLISSAYPGLTPGLNPIPPGGAGVEASRGFLRPLQFHKASSRTSSATLQALVLACVPRRAKDDRLEVDSSGQS